MRQIVSLVLTLTVLAHLSPAFAAGDVASQITATPVGANIEVRLKDKQTLRGARGEVSDSGFTLVNPSGGNRQIAFDDVASVKQLTKKSHTTRNVLIIAGVALVVIVAVIAIHIKNCGPFGCGNHSL